MRPTVSPYFQSTKEEIQKAQQLMDDAGNLATIVAYAEELVKSEDQKDVEKSLTFVDEASKSPEAEEFMYQLEDIKIIALFRLGRDEECKKEIAYARQTKKASCVVKEVEAVYKKEKDARDFQKKVNIGVGAATVAVTVIAGFVGFTLRKKNK